MGERERERERERNGGCKGGRERQKGGWGEREREMGGLGWSKRVKTNIKKKINKMTGMSDREGDSRWNKVMVKGTGGGGGGGGCRGVSNG